MRPIMVRAWCGQSRPESRLRIEDRLRPRVHGSVLIDRVDQDLLHQLEVSVGDCGRFVHSWIHPIRDPSSKRGA